MARTPGTFSVTLLHFCGSVIVAEVLLSSLRFQLICQINLLADIMTVTSSPIPSDPDGRKQTRVFPDIYHFNLHPVSVLYPSET